MVFGIHYWPPAPQHLIINYKCNVCNIWWSCFHHDLTIIQRHLVMPLTFCSKKLTWSVLQIWHLDCMLYLWLACCCFATYTTKLFAHKIAFASILMMGALISQPFQSLSIITITPPRHPVITYTNLCEGMWPSALACVSLFFLAISYMCHLFITTQTLLD